jgi:hypothetical protein
MMSSAVFRRRIVGLIRTSVPVAALGVLPNPTAGLATDISSPSGIPRLAVSGSTEGTSRSVNSSAGYNEAFSIVLGPALNEVTSSSANSSIDTMRPPQSYNVQNMPSSKVCCRSIWAI